MISVSLLPPRLISTSLPAAVHAAESVVQITILYDVFGKRSAMEKDWGYSAFVDMGLAGRDAARRWRATDPDKTKARRVAEEMLKQVKFDVAKLEAAFRGS